MLLFWSLNFSLNLKQEVRSVLLDFYSVPTLYFFPYVSIVEAGRQGILICIQFVTNTPMISTVAQIEEDMHIAWPPLLQERCSSD
jgi:hypothetical protein